MPTSYEIADATSKKLMDKVVEAWHPELLRYEVRIGLIMAYGAQNEGGEITRKPIIKNGVACAGQVRIVSLKDRLTKLLDIEVVVDGDLWNEYDDLRKLAILDHELEHIRVCINDKGELEHDPLDRPKLKLIHDDICFWGFSLIAARHGVNSQEVLCFKQLLEKYSNVLIAEH